MDDPRIDNNSNKMPDFTLFPLASTTMDNIKDTKVNIHPSHPNPGIRRNNQDIHRSI